eukprot:m.937686 g.937686  ORF g.937686 m.937686 type:complete len:52 (+) comp23815_c0_seq35:4051-4206(+)
MYRCNLLVLPSWYLSDNRDSAFNPNNQKCNWQNTDTLGSRKRGRTAVLSRH